MQGLRGREWCVEETEQCRVVGGNCVCVERDSEEVALEKGQRLALLSDRNFRLTSVGHFKGL